MKKTAVINSALLFLALGCYSSPGDPETSESSSGRTETFDHSTFDRLLKAHAKGGAVDYEGLKRDETELDAYIEKLATAELNKLNRGERLALFINAYNAFTLKLILEHYPQIHSIKDIPASKRWKNKRWNVGGKGVSLNDLEHNILRAQFHEPRIHFAIVCASVGCPDLSSSAYTGDMIDEQLNEAAKTFFASSKHVKVAAEKGMLFGVNYNLYVSPILKWFSKDFGGGKDSIIKYVEKYADKEIRTFIQAHRDQLNLKYLDYDWGLNDQKKEK